MPGAHGIVRLRGNWLEVTFAHDLRVGHVLQGLGGRRLGLGVWRVPRERAADAARRLSEFGFDWEDDAATVYQAELEAEQRWRKEDALALRVKHGEQVLARWQSPVPLLAHQGTAAEFLAVRSGALLCDEQGLGKTLSVLVAYWLLRHAGAVDRLLVVCPNSLKYNWRLEAKRFFPDWSVCVVHGYKGRRRRAYESEADIYVVNYEAARSDQADLRLLLRRARTVLACDESHSAKNPDSRTAHALAFLRTAAARVWLMTGTPVTNRLEDCYAQVFLADGGRLLGTKDEFWERYVRTADPQVAAERLRQALQPMLLRRTKEEVLDLPEKVFQARHIELKGEQRQMYDAVRRHFHTEIVAMPRSSFDAALPNILTRLLRLAQIASNPRLVFPGFAGEPAKFKEIDRLLEELIQGNGRKVVLWSYYVQNIRELLKRYQHYHPVVIYGAIGIDDRAAAVKRFQHDDDAMLLIGNPQAAGMGLTLTAAHYAIYESLNWRYDLYAQSLDRTHRIGQTKNVTYFRLLGVDTIDLDIDASLQRKQALAASVLGDAEQRPSLTKDEVLAMLSRHPEP